MVGVDQKLIEYVRQTKCGYSLVLSRRNDQSTVALAGGVSQVEKHHKWQARLRR